MLEDLGQMHEAMLSCESCGSRVTKGGNAVTAGSVIDGFHVGTLEELRSPSKGQFAMKLIVKLNSGATVFDVHCAFHL